MTIRTWSERFGAGFSRLTSGRARGGVVALVSSSAAGQILTVATMPLIARFYAPDAFGIFSMIFAACAVITAFSALRLDAAIPLAVDLDEARALTRMALALAAGFALIAAVITRTFTEDLSRIAGFDIVPWAWWLPPLILLTSGFTTLSHAALRHREYGQIATRTLAQSLGTVSGQLAFATLTRSAGGLLSGQLVGRAFGLISLARTSQHLLVAPAPGSFRKSLRHFWRFPAIFAPSALLNTLGTNMPLLLIGVWFGPQAAGYLGITQRVALAPSALVGSAISQVFSGELAARIRDGKSDNRRIYLRTTVKLMAVGVPLAIILLGCSKWAFPLILGDRWQATGSYAQAIALSVGFGFIVSPVSYVFLAYQRSKSSLLLNASRIPLVGGLGLVSYLAGGSSLETVWAMTAGQIINYAMTWIVGLWIVSVPASSRLRANPTGR